MKIVIGLSRWTNPSRPHIRHIDNGEGKPVCGDKKRKKVFSYEREIEGEPTCKECIKMAAHKWGENPERGAIRCVKCAQPQHYMGINEHQEENKNPCIYKKGEL